LFWFASPRYRVAFRIYFITVGGQVLSYLLADTAIGQVEHFRGIYSQWDIGFT
jgi:hypothetical protein